MSYPKKNTIFITGGSGFIGSTLARILVKENKVYAYDNGRRFSQLLNDILRHKNFCLVKGDILDKKRLIGALPKKIDIFIHLAAIAGVSSYYDMPVKTMATNIIGTYNALEAACKKRVSIFINFSTSEVYARRANRMSEDGETVQGEIKEKRWTYSLSKLAAEKLAFSYYWEKRLPIVSIRPFNIYGPGQVGEGAIQIFIKNALQNRAIHVTGDGSQVRAWCYIDDLVDALFRCINVRKAVGSTFNIGNDKAKITTLGLARRIVKITGSKSKILLKPHIGADIKLRVPTIEKAKEILGYRPQISLDEGLLRTIRYERKELI